MCSIDSISTSQWEQIGKELNFLFHKFSLVARALTQTFHQKHEIFEGIFNPHNFLHIDGEGEKEKEAEFLDLVILVGGLLCK